MEVPAGALAQVAGRLVLVGRRKHGGHRLESRRGQVEQQLAQVRATGHAAQVLLDGLAPAACHAAAHHGLQRGLGLGAVFERVGVHGHVNGLHHQLAVDGNAQPHVVDGFTGTAPAGIAKRGGVVHLAVVQLAFDVPQPIVAFIALVIDAALVPGGAGGRGAQGHGEEKTSCKSERGRAEATMLAAHRRAVVHRRDRACRSQPC